MTRHIKLNTEWFLQMMRLTYALTGSLRWCFYALITYAQDGSNKFTIRSGDISSAGKLEVSPFFDFRYFEQLCGAIIIDYVVIHEEIDGLLVTASQTSAIMDYTCVRTIWKITITDSVKFLSEIGSVSCWNRRKLKYGPMWLILNFSCSWMVNKRSCLSWKKFMFLTIIHTISMWTESFIPKTAKSLCFIR